MPEKTTERRINERSKADSAGYRKIYEEALKKQQKPSKKKSK